MRRNVPEYPGKQIELQYRYERSENMIVEFATLEAINHFVIELSFCTRVQPCFVWCSENINCRVGFDIKVLQYYK